MVAIGDSFVSGEPFLTSADTFVPIVAERMGMNLAFMDGQGGTGYIRDAHGRADTFAHRLPDLAAFHADLLLISGGYNDTWEMRKRGAHDEALTAATKTLELARTVARTVLVIGPIWPRAEAVPTEAVDLADHIRACCARLGLGFVDSLHAFDATDRTTAIDADGTHPTRAGHAHVAAHVLANCGVSDAH